jgi:transposase
MTDHTTIPKVSRLEVIETGARRRWTVDQKLRIVAESQSGARQVSATARRHGLSPALLFTWRRLAREGRLRSDDPVTFARAVIARGDTPVAAGATAAAGRIEVVLPDGLRMIVDAAMDAGVLAGLIDAIERR